MIGIAIYLLFIYAKRRLNPEKDDSIRDIPGLITLYKESNSKLTFDAYSSLAKYIVNGGKH